MRALLPWGPCGRQSGVSWGGKGDGRAGAKKHQAGLGSLWGARASSFPTSCGHLPGRLWGDQVEFPIRRLTLAGMWGGPADSTFCKWCCSTQRRARLVSRDPDVAKPSGPALPGGALSLPLGISRHLRSFGLVLPSSFKVSKASCLVFSRFSNVLMFSPQEPAVLILGGGLGPTSVREAGETLQGLLAAVKGSFSSWDQAYRVGHSRHLTTSSRNEKHKAN